jgi:uroporphyrinogen-III decarboxylase
MIFHSDGTLGEVLDDLRATGVDGRNPLEPLSKMYAGDIRKMFPDRILMGGIDASQLLPFGTEGEVRAAVRTTIDDAGAQGRLWLGSSTEIHPAVKLENVLAMWDEIENYGYYDK